MLRIARRQQARIAFTFTDAEGERADPAAGAIVTVYAGDVQLVTGAALPLIDTGDFEFRFASPQTDALGPLRAEWVAEIDGVEQTYETWHEIVGAHIVSVAQLRKREGLDDAVKYPTPLLMLARDVATYALEDECNTAFVRRVRTDAVASGYSVGRFALERARDIRIAAGTADARVLAAQELSGLIVERGGLVVATYGSTGLGTSATITYEYGYTTPPPRVARAVEILAAEWAQENADETSIPARATMIDSDAGNIRLVTAGEFGRAFDIPEVNAVVQRYKE